MWKTIAAQQIEIGIRKKEKIKWPQGRIENA